MSREIKFRVWHPTQGMTYTPVLSTSSYTGNVSCLGILLDKTRTNLHLMQFTGLKDKNGTEIYEGDIIGFGDDSPSCSSGLYGELGQVMYDEHDGRYIVFLSKSYREVSLADHLLFSDGHTCRMVYGNIHENLELIKDKPE